MHNACDNGPPAYIIKPLLDIGGKDLRTLVIMKDCSNEVYSINCTTSMHVTICASADVIKMIIDVCRRKGIGHGIKEGSYGNTNDKADETVKLVHHVGYTETLLMGKDKKCKTHLLTLLLGREHRTKSEEKAKQRGQPYRDLLRPKSIATTIQRFDANIGGKCKESLPMMMKLILQRNRSHQRGAKFLDQLKMRSIPILKKTTWRR